MHGAFLFWLIPLFFFAMVTRRRRWERWAMMGPRDEMMMGGWRYRDRYRADTALDHSARQELEQQQGYIEALETRVAELEARLDFTEQLVGQRSAPSADR